MRDCISVEMRDRTYIDRWCGATFKVMPSGSLVVVGRAEGDDTEDASVYAPGYWLKVDVVTDRCCGEVDGG